MKAAPRRPARGRLPLRLWLSLCAALAGGGLGCSHPAGSALVIVVTVSGTPPPITSIEVSISGAAGVSTQQYQRPDGQPLPFPTTLAAQLPSRISGQLSIEVRAADSMQATVASGREGPLAVQGGETQTVYVRLDCNGSSCGGAPDAGAASGDGGDGRDGWDWSCGNGRIDPGETCDTGIPDGQPGACPPATCNDGIACTTDTASGQDCTLICAHVAITALVAGDGCCPAGGTFAQDPDCSPTCGNGVVDPGETCDLQIAAGQPGACPAAAGCDDGDPCTSDLLISGGTCAARCTHVLITAQSGARLDGCCPVGAINEYDADCPVACGNGLVEDDELCDTGIDATAPGACPRSCDDGDPCTSDVRAGQGCRVTCTHTPITTFTSGDGCCPAGADRNTDSDCPAACGNGALEVGESCDKAITSGPAACPTACPSPSACIKRSLIGDASQCTARCTTALVTACSTARDGCCPPGCTAASDPDCSPSCGNGAVDADAGETCDVAITSGPGACPQSCPACSSVLVAAGTCQAACVFLPVTDFKAGDGCCPAGGTFDLDPDCEPTCGNGVVEPPAETCDSLTAPGACANTCPPSTACRSYVAQGSVESCDFRCLATTVTACAGGDGCCPPGCDATSDGDCAPLCGNGVLEAGERCDKGITAGQPGACDGSCDDLDPCTADFASGTVGSCSRFCSHVPITACAGGDRCCPAGCNAGNDHDCASVCGDGVITGAETCDPPSSCPTVCPDDGDRCTLDRLVGDPLSCSSICVHTPITACSGAKSDLCCPTGCDSQSDVDC